MGAFCAHEFRSFGGAGGEFAPVFVPGVDPASLAAGEGVASYGEDVADIADGEGVQFLPLGVAGVVPTAVLEDVECVAVGDHFALGGGDGVYLLAFLVIDVMPGACGLDIADALCPHGCECHEHDEDNEDSFHFLVAIALISD